MDRLNHFRRAKDEHNRRSIKCEKCCAYFSTFLTLGCMSITLVTLNAEFYAQF